MGMVPVDIYVSDDTPSTDPVPGVFVSVLDPITFVVIATATTDGTGKAAFVLNGAVSPGTNYEVRFFKLGATFDNPMAIAVEDPPVTTNKFDMSCTLYELPPATDPRVCRCSGRFMNLSNSPIRNATVRFMAIAETGNQKPKIVDGNIISADTLATRTDDSGFVTVDLIRGGEFYVTFSGEDDVIWKIKVPDRSSVNLIDLIHPFPSVLDWDSTDAPLNSISLAVGEVKTVKYSAIFTNYEESDKDLINWFDFSTSNSNAVLNAFDGFIAIGGVTAGAVSISPAIKPEALPNSLPLPTLSFTPLSVTVT